MKEVFRNLKFDKDYQISNYGRLYSKKSSRFLKPYKNSVGRLYISLSSGSTRKVFSLAKLVLYAFKKEEIDKTFAIHIDGVLENLESRNLEWGTLGDALRMLNTLKNKKRGVYPFNVKNKLKDGSFTIFKRFRAVIKINNKTKTIGYFKTEKEAEECYLAAFKAQYGYYPYIK